MQPRHYAHWPPNTPKSLTYPKSSVFYNFEVSSTRYPDKPFVVFYGHVTTFREGAAQIDALASFLRHACEIGKGDRVLIDLQNSPQFVLAFYATLRADAVVVPVNPMSRTEELRHYLNDSEATVAVIAQDTVDAILPLLADTPLRTVVVVSYSDYLPADEAVMADLSPPAFVREPARLPEHPHARSGVAGVADVAQLREAAAAGAGAGSLPAGRPEDTDLATAAHEARLVISWKDTLAFGALHPPGPYTAGPDDGSCLPYTSGSTGWPKGCMHTHASMMATCVMIGWWKRLSPDAVSLATAPFFHVTGMVSSMNAPIYMGATSVILPRWDPVVAARMIERFKVSNWTNVPTMVVDLLSNPDAAKHDLSSLGSVTGGGAAMPEAIAKKLHEQYGLQYIEGYGMTEFISATHMNPHHRPKRQCLGIPTFDTESHIIDPDTGRVLGPNEQGEIVARGPQLMRGYWKHPEETAASLIEIDGKLFFRTGDLGHMDEDGYFFISDRLKRMINASGFKVWPAEVENFFYQHPAIQECCIIASPDERRGETVKLVAVKKPGHEDVTADQLIAWARDTMAVYKVPRKIEFVDALPRTSSGKIFWRGLQDREFGRG